MATNETRIETDRLVLRTPRPADAAAIYQGINDFDVVRMLARAPWPYRPEDADAFVARCGAADPARDRPLAIEHRQHGVIGMTGFNSEEGEPFPDFGYWIARDHWGQGYATEAANAALVWAREGWGRRAVRAGHFVENAGVRPGAGQGRHALYRRGCAASLRGARRGRALAQDDLAGVKFFCSPEDQGSCRVATEGADWSPPSSALSTPSGPPGHLPRSPGEENHGSSPTLHPSNARYGSRQP